MGCGGAEVLIGAIARNLVKKGHEVRIACLLDHHETWPNYPDREQLLDEVPLKIVGGSVVFRFLRAPQIDNSGFVDYVTNFKPDVIHSHLYLSELLSRSAILPRIKYFSHGHDNMPQLKSLSLKTFKSKALLANFWERHWLLNQYKKCKNEFIAISQDVKTYLSEEVSEFKKHIHYLPNAIDIERFENKRDYTPVTGRFHMVSIANLVPKKNHIFLVDVMQELVKRGYNVSMDVLGAGPLMDMLIEKTQSAGLADRLCFQGSVGDIPARLANAQLYVHPAWYEPFGLVIVEAMASGLPVIALDGYGNRELSVQGKNGFLVAADASAADFADKIAYMIDHPELAEEMGRFAKTFAQKFNIDTYTDKLLDIYSR